MRWGLEAWNRPDEGTAEEWARVDALGGGCLKLRAYHPIGILKWWLRHNPEGLLLLRRSEDGQIAATHQVSEAQPLLEWIAQNYPAAKVVYLLDNEPNHPDSPSRRQGARFYLNHYLEDLGALIVAFQSAFPWVELASPPLAVQHEDLTWGAAIWPLCDRLGVKYKGAHLYWQYGNADSADWGQRIEQYASVAPGSRWIVDEVGDSTPQAEKSTEDRLTNIQSVLTYLADRRDVDAATLFLAAGGTKDWAEYVLPLQGLWDLGDYMVALAELKETEEGETVDAKLSMYADWAKARLAAGEDPRDVAAFVAHLKALGAEWQRPHECGLPYVEVRPFSG